VLPGGGASVRGAWQVVNLVQGGRRHTVLALGDRSSERVFVDHTDTARAARLVRTALARLDHEDYPALTSDVEVIVAGANDHAVFYQGH